MGHLGEDLQNYRSAENLTQQQMAEILNVGYRTYQEIERTGDIKKTEVMDAARNILNGALKAAPEKSRWRDSKPVYGHDFSMLVKAHLLLVEANADLSSAHKRLSEKVTVIVRETEEIRLIAAASIDALRELAKEQALKSGLYHSGREFLEAYDKKVNEFVRKKQGVGSSADADNKNRKKS